jgi:hypothetical protein
MWARGSPSPQRWRSAPEPRPTRTSATTPAAPTRDAKAGANSQAWFTLVVADAIQGDAGSGMITQQQADCIKAAYAATGSPSSFTVLVKGAVGQNGVIAAHNPHSEHAADGKGIDHLFPAYGQQILGSYAACGVQF